MAHPSPPTISVVVPTYRRMDDLRRCLTALMAQETPAHQVVVVYRIEDCGTRNVLDALPPGALPLLRAHPPGPGVVAAYNCGIDNSSGEVIAFTDDDAEPQPDWLSRLAAAYQSDPSVAGVGGRDRLHVAGLLVTGRSAGVGRVQWFGRTQGNHHTGFGLPRDVDILKGVNMSFRRSALGAIRFDSRLLGPGAQVDCEMAVCLTLRRQGARLVYDPAIVVDHHTALRHDIDQRRGFNAQAQFNQAHNETLVILEHLSPLRRLAFLCWAFLLGSRAVPGLGQAARLALFGIERPAERTIAALLGRRAAIRTLRQRTAHRPFQGVSIQRGGH